MLGDPPSDAWISGYQVWAHGTGNGATVVLVCLRCGPFRDVGSGETLTGCLGEVRRHAREHH